MNRNPDWQQILGIGLVLGAFIMGMLIYWTTTREVSMKKTECELSIPRNQNCVMQFVPEKSK